MPRYIGKPIPRLEDRRLITGNGRYTNDLAAEDACWACVVRSTHAHARIVGIDTDAARRRPGVLAVLTAADYAADGGRPINHVANTADAVDPKRPAFSASDQFVFEERQHVLAGERVRFVGEPVAVV